jgi:pilus assembly protein CpaF
MRPDRIVVGEVRGAEVLDMAQAMNCGHEGSLSTCHANSPQDALRRLEAMALLASGDLPLAFVRHQLARAVHLLVQVTRLPDGRRRVGAVVEPVGDDLAGVVTRSAGPRGAAGDTDPVGPA